MKFFNSCVTNNALEVTRSQDQPTQWVFVSQEQFVDTDGWEDIPRYTVRHWDGMTKSISSIDSFQQYASFEDANEAAFKFAFSLVEV